MPKNFILLQPTSPLRTVKFIDLAIRFFCKNSFTSLLSLKKIKNKVYNLKNKKCFSSKSMNYVSDGAIYIRNTEYFLKNKKLISLNNGYIDLPEKNNVDVDTSTIFRHVYDHMNTVVVEASIPQLVLILADYQYKAAFVADNELNIVACMTEVMAGVDFL